MRRRRSIPGSRRRARRSPPMRRRVAIGGPDAPAGRCRSRCRARPFRRRTGPGTSLGPPAPSRTLMTMSAPSGVRMPPGWSGAASSRPSWNITVNSSAPRLNRAGAFRGTRCSGRFAGSARRSTAQPCRPVTKSQRQIVGRSGVGMVAGRAGGLAVATEDRVVEQQLAQSDALHIRLGECRVGAGQLGGQRAEGDACRDQGSGQPPGDVRRSD